MTSPEPDALQREEVLQDPRRGRPDPQDVLLRRQVTRLRNADDVIQKAVETQGKELGKGNESDEDIGDIGASLLLDLKWKRSHELLLTLTSWRSPTAGTSSSDRNIPGSPGRSTGS